MARVLPDWGTVDPTPVCIAGGPGEEAAPALASDAAGGALKWRTVPGEALDLGRIFNEDPDQMCYASVCVHSDRDREAFLRTDTNDHNRAWLNGRLVHDGVSGAASSRGFDDYADDIRVRLRKGWNRLLLQVCNRQTTWMMSAQLTDETGEPIRDLTFAESAAVEAR